ncbi:DUF6266 family protein [Pedobacter sp. PLR]|uniref:DUF6266 family protein n=1 Tax=Pedobacter sp. PLR TaxID=2994465 RepID=UPI002246D423|nr:DUF6266 family protein [Pedobacter sp. PLR]MCX2449694.1 DUF6266 family protein [Pedobacter sp. PLR]
MGSYNPGAFGSFRGKVGQVVATKWKGKDVVKNLPQKTTKKASAAQLAHRRRFEFLNRFLGQFSDLISIGYRTAGNRVIPMNLACAYHLKNAVIGVYPDCQIDYSRLKLSFHKGIDAVVKPELSIQEGEMLTLSWQMPRFRSINTRADDRAYILVYNSEKDRCVKHEGPQRSDLTTNIPIPESYIGDPLHCWIFFVSLDGKLAAETQFVGTLNF